MPVTFEMHGKPWYCQWNYLVICAFLVFSPFLILPGQKPLFCLVIISTAMWMQTHRDLSVLNEKKPPELIFFTLWAFWAIGTGLVIAVNRAMFRDGVMQLTRMTTMLWAFFAIFYRQKNCTYFYYILVFVALIQCMASILGIQLDLAELTLVKGDTDSEFARAAGMTGNANAMGFIMLAAIWSCMVLWRADEKKASVHRKLVLLGLIGVFSYFIIQTASRKSLLVAAILLAGWFVWMLPGRFSFKSVAIAGLMAIILLVVGVFVVGYIMEDTYMGHRLQQWSDSGGGNLGEGFKENIRYWLYVEGFKMFLAHPITGVGLSQFAHHFYIKMYSHSDYMEPLACTGLVGFLLYHGFALAITLRIVRLLKSRLPGDVAYALKGMLLFMLGNHYLIGLGCPHWNLTDHNMIVMFIGVFAWKVQKLAVRRQYIYMA